jgi:hypothetical protein
VVSAFRAVRRDDIVEEDDVFGFGGAGARGGHMLGEEQGAREDEDDAGHDEEVPVHAGLHLALAKDFLHDEGGEGEDDDVGHGLSMAESAENEGEDDDLAKRAEDEHGDEDAEPFGLDVDAEGRRGAAVPSEDEDGVEAADRKGGLEDLGGGHEAGAANDGVREGETEQERAYQSEDEHDDGATVVKAGSGGGCRGQDGMIRIMQCMLQLLFVVKLLEGLIEGVPIILVEEAEDKGQCGGIEEPAQVAELAKDLGLILIRGKLDELGMLAKKSDANEGEEEGAAL